MESTGPAGGATAATSGKESDLSLLEQFKQAASDSSELDDSEFEDAVQTALGNALEDIFESGRDSSRPRSAAWGMQTAPKRPPSAGLRCRMEDSPGRKGQNPEELRQKLDKKEREVAERRRKVVRQKSAKGRRPPKAGKVLAPSTSKEKLDEKQRQADERRNAQREEKKRLQKEHNRLVKERCQARSAAVEEQLKEANLQTGIVQSGKCGISWNIAASNEPDTSLALPPILPLTADEQAQFIGKECKENISNAAARDAWMAEATVIEADLQIVDFDPEDAMTPRTEFAKTSAEDLRKEIESLESMESEGRESPPADVPKESSTLIGEKILDELMGPQEEQALSKALVSAINGEAIEEPQIKERLINMLLYCFPSWRSCITNGNDQEDEDAQSSGKGTKKTSFAQRVKRFFLRKSGSSTDEKTSTSKSKHRLFGCISAQKQHKNVVAPEVGIAEKKSESPGPRDKQATAKPKQPSPLTRIRKRGKVTPQCALGLDLKWYEKVMLWCY